MTVPLRAAWYLRVSTARQGEAYCAARGYQFFETYVEPGASATNDRRPEFQRMIEAGTSKPAPFDIVIVHLSNPSVPPPMRARDRAPAERERPARKTYERRPKAQPQWLIGRPDPITWMGNVVSARRRASNREEDSAQPPLFTDAEVRVVVGYFATSHAWLIDRSCEEKADLIVSGSAAQRSVDDMVADAHVGLRTNRRALRKAMAAGYLQLAAPEIADHDAARSCTRLTTTAAGVIP